MQNDVVCPRRSWERQQRTSAAFPICANGDGTITSTAGAVLVSLEGTAADEAASMHPTGQGPIVVKATEAPLNGPTVTSDAATPACTAATAAVSTRAVSIGPATEKTMHEASDLEAVPEKCHANSISPGDSRYNPTAAIHSVQP